MKSSAPPARLATSPMAPSRNAGTLRGSLSGWRPPRTASLGQQTSERMLAQGRAEDLTANDWAASSGVNAITANAVGTGLKPQSHINARRLGISKDQARELQNDIEAIWADWTPQAHVRGMLHFEDMQFLGLRTMLRLGELVHLPVMLSHPLRPVQLALQDVSPTRLRTPFDRLFDPSIVDGVQLGPYGAPEAYWLATPVARPGCGHVEPSCLSSESFTRIPARIGHRPGCFHLFRYTEDEQIRGHSVLNSGMNLFRHLSDSLDNELLAQVVTASMALFIAREKGTGVPSYAEEDEDPNSGDTFLHEEVVGGTVMYGNLNEKPYVLESSRPSPNFAAFSEFVLRAMAASIDMPYEVLAKDFSKTNYSSARAALMEAWRIFLIYRSWLTRQYCQPIWSMVIEEAWLAGHLVFPSGAPDFYDAPRLYTQATWIGPARGAIDPVKEIKATILALENHLSTYSEALAETGRDFDETQDTREDEEIRLSTLKSRFAPVATPPEPSLKPTPATGGSAPSKGDPHAAV